MVWEIREAIYREITQVIRKRTKTVISPHVTIAYLLLGLNWKFILAELSLGLDLLT
jgi:hypothetical protein